MSNIDNINTPTIWMPTTVENAVELKNQFGLDAEYVSGATLLQLQWINGRKSPKHMISLEQISSMNRIESLDLDGFNVVAIGACVTLGSYQTNSRLKELPILCDALKTIAAPAVRNRGTIGGNIMGGIGDLIPLLLSLDAIFEFYLGEEYRKIGIHDYLEQKDKFDSLLTTIYIPIQKDSSVQSTFYKKIGRRETFTAAILTVSGKINWSSEGHIKDVRLAIGGGDNKPMRLKKTEQVIQTANLNNLNWNQVYQVIMSEIVPSEDVFVSGQYRKKAAANLLIAELQSSLASKGYREEHVYEV